MTTAGWWRRNAEAGRTSVLYGYTLGKAQRLLGMLGAVVGHEGSEVLIILNGLRAALP